MSTPDGKVQVLYKYVDGAHFFVAGDKATKGLCVAHCDPRIAYDGVAPALTFLFKENHGEDVTVVPGLAFEVFAIWLDRLNDIAQQGPTPGIAGQVPWAMAEAA